MVLSGLPFLCQYIDSIKDVPTKNPTDIKYLIKKLNIPLTTDNNSSNKKLVLMLTADYDPEADLVGRRLWARGIDYVRLNTDDIPNRLQVYYSINKHGCSDQNFSFALGDTDFLDTSKIVVTWLHHFYIKEIKIRGNNALAQEFSFQQWNDAIYTLQRSMKNCKWINSPQPTLTAESDRMLQLSTARSVGFNIPTTLITNNPKAARDFYYLHNGNIVLKALHHHRVENRGKIYSMYTHRVSKQDLSRLDALSYAPCILQERVANKKSELRVTVVGNQLFATRIDSPPPTIEGWEEDIHRCPMSKLPMKAIESSQVKDSFTEQCIKLIKLLKLRYGALDFVEDKRGDITFLEVNPDGDWWWIERRTGQKITEAMVDLIEDLM
jgi:glutathione synthase/RimK-type ligase-like ATP-grasp enzyme